MSTRHPDPRNASPLEVLRHHVSGAIARGEGVAIVEQRPELKARTVYEGTRGLGAFNISGHSAKHRNGAATWYDFADGSRVTIYNARNVIAWGPDRATKYAERTLFGGHTAAAHISV